MAGLWKDGVQCAVNIGFDVDGVSSWLGRDGDFANRPVAMTMGEYGPKVGVPRILDLLDEYNIKGSFFVPGHTAENHPHIVPDLLTRGHEIAHHGYVHERPASLGEGEERRVLEKGMEILEHQSGARVTGYRSPSWDISVSTLDLLVEYGFTYDSSLMDDDAPYVHDVGESRLVELPVQWHLDDFPYWGYAPAAGVRGPLSSPEAVIRTWTTEFDTLYREGRCYILTLHPQVSGHPSRLSCLERTIQHIMSHPKVAFMRCDEIAQHWIERGLS